MANIRRVQDQVVTYKRVIVRVDFNVPIKNGEIVDDSRIRAAIPTIKYLSENKAKVVLLSHLGRPNGRFVEDLSLKVALPVLQELLPRTKIIFVDDCVGNAAKKIVEEAEYGDVILCENVRFHAEELSDDAMFARKLSKLGTLYVNDAFSCSHRNHSSIASLPRLIKGCAGLLFQEETANLDKYAVNPARPALVIIGGTKTLTKLPLLASLAKKVDAIALGGNAANAFLRALGHSVGKYADDPEYTPTKKELKDIIALIKESDCELILPEDVVVCDYLAEDTKPRNVSIKEVKDTDIIADIGQKTAEQLVKRMADYKTILWNGPLGIYEYSLFQNSSIMIVKEMAELTFTNKIISVVGGGDTVSLVNSQGLLNRLTYASMAGGAFLKWLEGGEMPNIVALSDKFNLSDTAL